MRRQYYGIVTMAGYKVNLEAGVFWSVLADFGTVRGASLRHFGRLLYAAQLAQNSAHDSGHFAHSREKRAEIANDYNKALYMGTIVNQEVWAEEHGICSRTLRNYLKDSPPS